MYTSQSNLLVFVCCIFFMYCKLSVCVLLQYEWYIALRISCKRTEVAKAKNFMKFLKVKIKNFTKTNRTFCTCF